MRVLGILFLVLFLIPAARAQTFTGPPLLPTASDVISLVEADVNNDGKPDLIYVDGQAYGQNAVHVLFGNGKGTFTHGQDIALPAGICCALTVADVTGDGKLDLVLAGNNNSAALVAVFAGNGDGTFQPPILSSFVPSGYSGYIRFVGLAVGDINGDGKMDAALFTGANIYLLLGNNSGTFALSSTLDSNQNGAIVDSIHLIDFNGDGNLDILTTDAIGAGFEVFLGSGNGTFSSYVRYTANTSAGPFLMADVNGDGRPDVLTVYYEANEPNQLGYFAGNPDGTFSSLINLGASPVQNNPLVSALDVNSDAFPDLTFLTPSGIAVSLGKSGPAFSAPLTTISGGSMSPYTMLPTTPVMADFNSDGHKDIAMAVEGGIVLLFGKGDGTFLSDIFYDMGQPVGSAAVAKFDGGNMDIAVTLPATFPRLLLGDGQGNFKLGPDPNSSYGSQTPLPTILAADFNGDGKPDLNLGNIIPNTSSSGTQSAAFNQGTGVFSTPVTVPNSSPIMADFNRDGRMDIINVAGAQIVVSLGQSDNTFIPVTTATRLPFDTGLFNVGDVNNDGKPDLILNYYDHLEVWLGNGDGTFTYSSSISLPSNISHTVAAVADVDGDGNGDILLAPDSNVAATLEPMAIFYGNGDGTFQSPVFLPVSHRYSQVVVADLNRDNLPDLVMTDGAAIAVIMNLGGGKFGAEVDYVAGRSIAGLNVVDVNSDGYPDIVVANGDGYYGVDGPNFWGTTVTILFNQPNGKSATGAPVTGNLTIAAEPSIAGQPFTITLSVAAQSGGATVPSGSVGFSVDGAFVADSSMTNGTASYIYTATLIPAQHTITATYNGDTNYAPRSFSVVHTVQPVTYSTQTTLKASPATVLASQTVRLSARISSSVPVPDGVVTFLDSGNSIGAEPIDSSGVASFDTALLAPGLHSLSATYQGFTQNGFNGNGSSYVAAIFTPSTSGVSTVLVNTEVTTVSLSTSSSSATVGSVVTFTSKASSTTGVPFGGMSFFDGGTELGTLPLDAKGGASFSTASLAAGPHTIIATFNANGPYASSTSTSLSIVITAAPATAIATIVYMTSPVNSADATTTLVATVSGVNQHMEGSVTFLDSGMILGTTSVDATGVATLAIMQMKSGAHTLTASYSGTSQFAPSASPALNEQWPSAGSAFSLAIMQAQSPTTASAAASLQVTVAPLGDFRQVVALSCSNGLPRAYTCEFSPPALAGSGKSSLLILPASKSAQSPPLANSWPVMAFAFFSALLLGNCDNRRVRSLVILLAIAVLGSISGCGGSSQVAEVEQTVVLTVQASTGSAAGAIIHSAQVCVRLPQQNTK